MGAVARRLFRRLFSSAGRRDQENDPAAPLQLLCELVVHGVGGLDEMESALDRLHVPVSPSLAAQLFDSAGPAADTRRLLRFLAWSRRRSGVGAAEDDALWWDEPFRRALRCFADKGDAAAMGILISTLHRHRRPMPPDTFACAAESLVKLGHPDDALRLLNLSGGVEGRAVLAVVHALCGGGQAAAAARVVARRQCELSPAEMAAARRSLVHGWCRGRNAREARKKLEEMKSAGERPGGAAYHALLRCLCERNVKFNPAALVPEAFSVVAEMRAAGEAPTAATLNLLLSCLARARRVKEACSLLQSMRRRDAGRPPADWTSYYLVARVLFLTGRYVRGKRVIRQMLEDGLAPPPGFFRRLMGLLCGVEKTDFAVEVFDDMRRRDLPPEELAPGYDLLIGKLCRSGKFDDGRRLWEEATAAGVHLCCSSELLDPSKTEIFAPPSEKKMISTKKMKKKTIKMKKKKKK